mgnify:FL=1
MKNIEEIICPKLKEKKQKQKLDRQAAKTDRVLQTAPVKKEIKTTNNFDIFKKMMAKEEEAEAAQKQKQQDEKLAQEQKQQDEKLAQEQKQQDEDAAKQLRRDTKKTHKKKGKKSKNPKQVYYDMPENLK